MPAPNGWAARLPAVGRGPAVAREGQEGSPIPSPATRPTCPPTFFPLGARVFGHEKLWSSYQLARAPNTTTVIRLRPAHSDRRQLLHALRGERRCSAPLVADPCPETELPLLAVLAANDDPLDMLPRHAKVPFTLVELRGAISRFRGGGCERQLIVGVLLLVRGCFRGVGSLSRG